MLAQADDEPEFKGVGRTKTSLKFKKHLVSVDEWGQNNSVNHVRQWEFGGSLCGLCPR